MLGRLASVGGFTDGLAIADGYVGLPALPGMGFEGKANFYRAVKALGAEG